ncbi:hypothetical protein E3A20_23800, partial [Planctomyces bekefii]
MTLTRRALGIALLQLASTVNVSPALTSNKLPTDGVKILQVVAAGNACPVGTTPQAKFSDSRDDLLVEIPKILVEMKNTVKIARSVCNMTVTLELPTGWQLSMANWEFEPDAHIEK